jgi:hypothetical protein
MKMLKKLTILAALSFGCMAFADVNIRTNISPVFVGGTCEQAGAVTFTVDNDDFANASTAEPVYIRMTLDHDAVLCETLVDRENASTPEVEHNPIYIPMRLEGGLTTDTIAANQETTSIVRWIGGEKEIWIKIQTSSSVWIQSLGGLISPDPTRPVSFNLGVSALISDQNAVSALEDPLNFNANLPYHVLESDLDAGAEVPNITNAISTLYCVNLANSNLQAVPAPAENSILNFDPISYQSSQGVETSATVGGIDEGAQQQINFSNDTRIARGFDLDECTFDGTKADENGNFWTRANAELCSDTVGGSDQTDANVLGLIHMTNRYGVEINCPNGINNGSWLRLTVPDEKNYGFLFANYDEDGFPEGSDGGEDEGPYNLANSAFDVQATDTTDMPASTWRNPTGYYDADSINAGGKQLSRVAETEYTGTHVAEGSTVRIYFSSQVCTWYEEEPTAVVLGVWAGITARDDFFALNNLTHREAWQNDFCDGGREILNIEWDFGDFVACGTNIDTEVVRIFYPYVPKLAGTDFVAGVSFVNQGAHALSVSANIYESDGEGWTTDFGDLESRHLQTWLLVDDEQGVGFYNFDNLDDVMFKAVTPMDETTKLLYGTLRSSMYIIGSASVGGNSGNAAGACDLDGYMLIANGNDLSGAYTPRNVEPHTANPQTGDLPVNATKSRAVPAEWPSTEPLRSRHARRR